MPDDPLRRLRPLPAVVAMSTVAAVAAAVLPAQAAGPPSERRGVVRGEVVARSTLGSTISWAYDVNDKGVGFAVWVDGDSGRRRVLAAKHTAKRGWGEPRRLSGLFSRKGKKEFSGHPDVAVDAKGRATVVWTQPKGSGVSVRVATSRRNGWSKPRTLSARDDHAGFPDIEVSDTGYAVVHWAGDFPFPPSSPFSLWAAYRQQDGSWSQPERLDTAPDFDLDARPESIAVDDRGVATVVWDEIASGGGATGRIQVATRGPQVGWSQQTLAVGVHGNSPSVATTPDGQLVAAWRDFDGVLVQRRDPAGGWGVPQEVVTGPAGLSHNLFGVGISRQGRVALLGQEVENAGDRVRPYVLVQDAPGSPWAREYVADGYRQHYLDPFQPDLHVGSRGEVAVTWNQQFASSSRWFRTFARLRTPAGQWKPVRQIGRRTSDPVLASDRRGRVSMVFGDGGRTRGCCEALRAARLR